MNDANGIAPDDRRAVKQWIAAPPDTLSVAGFVPGPGIQKLALRFDITLLRDALDECLGRAAFLDGEWRRHGFRALPLTRRPGDTDFTDNDLSGRYWLRRIMVPTRCSMAK